MIPIDSQWRRTARALFTPVALLAMLLVGCGGDGGGGRPATATPTAPPATATPRPTATAAVPNPSADAACEALTRCGQCFANQTGNCLDTAACAQRLAADVAICINGVGSCDQTALGDCLFLGCDGTDPSGECQ